MILESTCQTSGYCFVAVVSLVACILKKSSQKISCVKKGKFMSVKKVFSNESVVLTKFMYDLFVCS